MKRKVMDHPPPAGRRFFYQFSAIYPSSPLGPDRLEGHDNFSGLPWNDNLLTWGSPLLRNRIKSGIIPLILWGNIGGYVIYVKDFDYLFSYSYFLDRYIT